MSESRLPTRINGISRDLLQTARILVGHFFSSLRSNLGLAALALLLSASLWIFITGEQNPPRSDTFASEIPVEPVNVPKELDVLGAIPSVRVRIRAPEDVWENLSASNFTATVDLSGQDAGTERVPVSVRSKSKQVRVLSVIPDRIEVRLEALKRQTVPVKVNMLDSPPFGYTFETPQIVPDKVTVLGPESIISQVDFAVADVSLASEKVTIERSYKLVPRTERGHQIEGVTLEPASADVRVTIKQQLFFQTFGILPQTKGSPASGYWISGVTAAPQEATVFGPREVLQNIGFLKTKPVDISNASANVSRQVEVDLPEGSTMVGSLIVEARIAIAPIKGSARVQIAPEFEGLTGGRRPSLSISTVEVTLSGDLPVLNKLNPADVHATLNLKNLAPGSYQVEVKVTAPPGLQIGGVSPTSIGVVIPP